MPMKKKTPAKKSLPITISMTVAGQSKLIDTDSVLEFLRELDIDPIKIKSRMVLEITYNGNTLRRIYKIIQVRRMLISDLTKQVWAKYINSAIGRPHDDSNIT
jgi:hypothetical protein